MTEVVTAGEAMGLVRADGLVRHGGAARLSIAGAESNVAIGLARLGHTARWVGVVGADQLGALVVRTLRAEGVDVSHVRTGTGATGVLVREDRLAGVAHVDYHRRGSAGGELRPDDVATALTDGTRLVHVSGVTPALGPTCAAAVLELVRRARERGAAVCLDVNYRSRLWSAAEAARTLRTLLPHVDVVAASDDEIRLLTDAADAAAGAAALVDAGVREVVVTLGSAGALVRTGDGTTTVPARPVRAVDLVGAGDAFVAGYLSALLDGLAVPDRLDRGAAVAAFAVGAAGDWEGLPTRGELALLDVPPEGVVR